MPEPSERSGLRESSPAWNRILTDFFKPSRGQFMMAVVLCLVGLMVVAQVQSRKQDDNYSAMRRSDLVQLLDQLNAEQSRLAQESARLERAQEQLASGEDARRIAAQENRKRLDALAILQGLAPASGPGIRITIIDPQQKVGPDMLLDAVEEMRDAGAEAMELNDEIRVVGQTWFSRANGRLVVDGKPISAPLVIDVIGDPHALEEGARFRGGLVSQVQAEQVGGHVLISRLDTVRVDSLHQPKEPEWARPA